jgi:BirA family biotin operon repressor/biotin-[acetyl-CoA-carboxylase] ligase
MFLQRYDSQDKMTQILFLLSQGETVSGEVMSQKVGVSRNAIWKQINNLRELGYEILAETKSGYRLVSRPDRLYPMEFWPYRKTINFGNTIYWDYDIPSTNDKAQELARAGAEEGTIVLAETQSQGRGRRGRAWQSAPSQGIYLSLILRPVHPLAEASPYTFLGAYAVLRFCRELGIPALVKWPNDIHVNGLKISGILTELSATGQDIGHIVLGLGLNVNQKEFPKDIPATSLSLELKQPLSRVDVLARLLVYLEEGYRRLNQDSKWLIQVMRENSLLLGKEVVVTGGVELEGTAEDIALDGALLIRTPEKLVKVWAGDVSVRPRELKKDK